MNVIEFITSLNIKNSNENVNNYFYELKKTLNQNPYHLNINWDGKLFTLTSNKKRSDFSNDALNNCNGIILEAPEFDSCVPQLIAYSFPVISDYNNAYEENVKNNWDKYDVESMIDGAIIRLYYYEGKWCLSTIKKIDANRTSWEGKDSFQTLFNEAAANCGLDYTVLNKEYCYTFVLCHPNNHMIVSYDTKMIYHVNTTQVKEDNIIEYVNHDIGIKQCNRYENLTFEQFNEIINKELDKPITVNQTIGLILTNKETGAKIKVDTRCYKEARDLKGNVPNIKYRVIRLLLEEKFNLDSERIIKFCQYYPQYKKDVDHVNERVNKLTTRLFGIYKSNGYEIPMNHNDLMEFHFITELHFKFLETNHRSNFNVFNEQVKQLSQFRLASLLKIPFSYNHGHNNRNSNNFEFNKFIHK